MSFKDYAFSTEMRDTIIKIVESTIDKVRPRYRYGVVSSVDTTTLTCLVVLNGDATAVSVSMNGLPATPGRTVRVEGNGTDRYVAAVVGEGHAEIQPYTDVNTLVAPGMYRCDSTAISNTLKNWPVPAVPSVDTWDSENPLASYTTAPYGSITVHTAAGRVFQRAELVGIPGSIRPMIFVWTRIRTAAGYWNPWTMENGVIRAHNASEQDNVGRFCTTPTRDSPLEVLRTEFTVPHRVQTVDGIRWSRDATGTMQTTPAWRTPSLLGTWVPYSAGYGSLQVIRTSAGIISLRGLVKNGAVGSVIGVLPPGYRPSAKLMFLISDYSSASGGRIDVYPNGNILFVGNTSGGTAWVGVDSIQFPAADVAPNSAWTNVTFANGFTSHHELDSTWPGCQWWQDSIGRVWFRGLARRAAGDPAADTRFAYIPGAYSPSGTIHYTAASSGATGFASLHIFNLSGNTDLYWKIGSAAGNSGFFSLSGIRLYPASWLPENGWQAIPMVGTWANYNAAAYPPASLWNSTDGLVLIRGLVKNGAFGSLSSPITVNNRQNGGPQIWLQNADNKPARVNNGGVEITVATGSNVWLSLDGICWFNEG